MIILRTVIPALIAGMVLGSCLYHPAGHAADMTIRPERVISVVTSDWNGDGSFDRALLLVSEKETDEVDLLIYLSASDKPNELRLAVNKANIAWRGAMWGTQPSLEVNERKSLIITSANDAIGRGRWTRKLTLVYLGKSFVVAGYTYNSYDTLDVASHSACDVNLLTGNGIKNKKPFKTTLKAVAVAEWSTAAIPPECRQS